MAASSGLPIFCREKPSRIGATTTLMLVSPAWAADGRLTQQSVYGSGDRRVKHWAETPAGGQQRHTCRHIVHRRVCRMRLTCAARRAVGSRGLGRAAGAAAPLVTQRRRVQCCLPLNALSIAAEERRENVLCWRACAQGRQRKLSTPNDGVGALPQGRNAGQRTSAAAAGPIPLEAHAASWHACPSAPGHRPACRRYSVWSASQRAGYKNVKPFPVSRQRRVPLTGTSTSSRELSASLPPSRESSQDVTPNRLPPSTAAEVANQRANKESRESESRGFHLAESETRGS